MALYTTNWMILFLLSYTYTNSLVNATFGSGEKLVFAIVAWSTVGVSKYSTLYLKELNKHKKDFFNPLCSVESAHHAEKEVEKK